MSDIDFDTELTKPQQPKIEDVIVAFQNSDDGIVSSTILYGLSDLSIEDRNKLRAVWDKLPASFKHKIFTAMIEASESNFELNYRTIGLLGLQDASPLVRSISIDLLWEDESLELLNIFSSIAQHDESPQVRANAVSALGRFILLGEYEEIPESNSKEAQKLTIQLYTDVQQPIEVRRRALESLSNSSHKDVARHIRDAYNHDDQSLNIGAIFAMGRTCDDQWEDILLDELDSSESERVYEAARACGEIQLSASVRRLGKLIADEDQEIQEIAIWALGEIGSREAVRILENLRDEVEDDYLAEVIEEAIDSASFSLSGAMFDFDLDEDD